MDLEDLEEDGPLPAAAAAAAAGAAGGVQAGGAAAGPSTAAAAGVGQPPSPGAHRKHHHAVPAAAAAAAAPSSKSLSSSPHGAAAQPGAHSGRFSRASSHSGRLKPALSVVLADEDPDQEAGEGGGEVVRVSPAGEAPALAPADMAAELTRLAAELRGNVRDTAIRLDAIIGSGSFGTVYRGEEGAGRGMG